MEAGAIETLIIWKDIDLYRLHNPKTKEIKIIYLRNDELEEFEKIRFVDWLAINYRTLGKTELSIHKNICICIYKVFN